MIIKCLFVREFQRHLRMKVCTKILKQKLSIKLFMFFIFSNRRFSFSSTFNLLSYYVRNSFILFLSFVLPLLYQFYKTHQIS